MKATQRRGRLLKDLVLNFIAKEKPGVCQLRVFLYKKYFNSCKTKHFLPFYDSTAPSKTTSKSS
jgi:hypothetical protein